MGLPDLSPHVSPQKPKNSHIIKKPKNSTKQCSRMKTPETSSHPDRTSRLYYMAKILV